VAVSGPTETRPSRREKAETVLLDLALLANDDDTLLDRIANLLAEALVRDVLRRPASNT
jgi:hypothetical protein